MSVNVSHLIHSHQPFFLVSGRIIANNQSNKTDVIAKIWRVVLFFIIVDFPEPDCPIMATKSPFSTEKLTSVKIKKIEEKVSKELGKKITLKNLIDKELIGGFKIVVGSIVIEDSVKSELKAMKDSLIFNSKEGGV